MSELTMPIDTLADAIDSTQCGMAVSEDFIRSLDVSSMALVDIAVSLRALSGRPPVTDTPMQKRMREAIDKGEDPKAAIERCFYGGSFASSYVEAFKRAYKPRSASNLSRVRTAQENGRKTAKNHSQGILGRNHERRERGGSCPQTRLARLRTRITGRRNLGVQRPV